MQIYNTYIKSVTDGRQIYYQCIKGYMLKGTIVCVMHEPNVPSRCCTVSIIAVYCPHPSVARAFHNGHIRMISMTGSYVYEPYMEHMADSREIIYECESGYYLQGTVFLICSSTCNIFLPVSAFHEKFLNRPIARHVRERTVAAELGATAVREANTSVVAL